MMKLADWKKTVESCKTAINQLKISLELEETMLHAAQRKVKKLSKNVIKPEEGGN